MERNVADEFDPYYTWLGIRPEEQPADHYRLIGLRQFEDHGDVISNALDQKMQFLRTMQVGKRAALSQKLLNEISAAGGCLLDKQKKQAYDQMLKAKQAAQQAAVHAQAAAARPLPRPMPVPQQVAVVPPVALPPAPRPLPLTAPAQPAAESIAPKPRMEFSGVDTSSRKSSSWKLPVMLGGGVLSLIVLGVSVMYISRMLGPGEKKVASHPTKPAVTPEKNVTKPARGSLAHGDEVTAGNKSRNDHAGDAGTRTGRSPRFLPRQKLRNRCRQRNAQAWWKDPAHVEQLLGMQIGTDAYAEFPDSASRSTLATPLTAEFWLRLHLVGDKPVQILGTLLGGEGVVPKGWSLFAKRLVQGDKVKEQLYVEFWKPTGDFVGYPVTLSSVEWHHIAFVFEPEKPGHIYVDGKPMDFPAEKNLSTSQRNLKLGSEMQLSGAAFKAEICGLRVSESVRYRKEFSPPSPLDMKPDDATFAAIDCRLYHPAAATPDKPYPWLYGTGKFDPQSTKIVNFQPFRFGTARQWQGGKKRPDNKLDWIALDPFGGCPGKGPDQLAVRRWVAPADGEVSLTGHLRHFHSWRAGDGVKARIVSSSTGTAGEWRAFFQDVDTPAQGLKVQAGDTIDFVIDCEKNSDCDVFDWIVDLKLVDAQQQVVGTWNSARDFRVIPSPAEQTARLPDPVRSKAQWIPLENFATILTTREAPGDQAQLVAQYAPAAPAKTLSPLTLKPVPANPPSPFGEPSPFGPPAAKKSPVPDAAALAKAKAEVLQVFGDDLKAAKAPKQKQELAQKIFDLVKDTSEAPTRYALLEDVRRLAVEGRDGALAMKAVELSAEQFEVDLLAKKVKVFEGLAAEGLTPAPRRSPHRRLRTRPGGPGCRRIRVADGHRCHRPVDGGEGDHGGVEGGSQGIPGCICSEAKAD